MEDGDEVDEVQRLEQEQRRRTALHYLREEDTALTTFTPLATASTWVNQELQEGELFIAAEYFR